MKRIDRYTPVSVHVADELPGRSNVVLPVLGEQQPRVLAGGLPGEVSRAVELVLSAGAAPKKTGEIVTQV
ncbi:MAG: hypothetical protein NZ561_02530, partial [Phycisphaerae bacterium]|nr:hypothetical protein [Phycisphaerae bacterium]MDW8261725.1 hypothetical protein [Phycisphaerales bacterium]